jgi:hypothetical protein
MRDFEKSFSRFSVGKLPRGFPRRSKQKDSPGKSMPELSLESSAMGGLN